MSDRIYAPWLTAEAIEKLKAQEVAADLGELKAQPIAEIIGLDFYPRISEQLRNSPVDDRLNPDERLRDRPRRIPQRQGGNR